MDIPYKISVAGLELTIVNATETLHIGGPYLGDVYIGENLMSKNCVLDNFLVQPSGNNLFYVKYQQINQYGYFRINFFNLLTKTAFEFDKDFAMVHLKEFSEENEIHIYQSFNDAVGNNFYFKLDEEEFKQVN